MTVFQSGGFVQRVFSRSRWEPFIERDVEKCFWWRSQRSDLYICHGAYSFLDLPLESEWVFDCHCWVWRKRSNNRHFWLWTIIMTIWSDPPRTHKRTQKMTMCNECDDNEISKLAASLAIIWSQICCDIYVGKQAQPWLDVMVIKQSGREHRWTLLDRDMNTKILLWIVRHEHYWPNTWLTVVSWSGQNFYNLVKWLYQTFQHVNIWKPKIFTILIIFFSR